MKLYKVVAWALVFLMHASLLVSCISKEPSDNKNGEGTTQVEPLGEQATTLIGMGGQGLACKYKYRGIGVMIDPGSFIVNQVAFGGPAYVGGVRIGDRLMSTEYFGGYDIGQTIIIRIERNNTPIELKVIINDICYE